jgi:formate dehydrogenase maturation protein FdhE
MINILNFTSKYTKVIVGRCVEPELLDVNSLKPAVIDNFSNFLSNTSVEEFYYTWLMNLLEEYKYSNKNNEKMKNYLEKLDKVRNTNSKDVLPWCWV